METMTHQEIIAEELEKASDENIQYQLLKASPQIIPALADWVYADWYTYDPSLTKEKLIQGFLGRLHDDKLPLALVALHDNHPIGVLSLKATEDPELAPLSQGNPWLGSHHVLSSYANQGIEKQLLQLAKNIAERLGHRHLFVYTSSPTQRDTYLAQGSHLIEQRPFRDHPVWIFKLNSKKIQ